VFSILLLTLALAPAAPVAADVSTPDFNKVVCRRIDKTGSRLGSAKVCATKAEWAERERRDQEDLKKAQVTHCVDQCR
jgi:hypothetical protein